jgi:hypothetical protein
MKSASARLEGPVSMMPVFTERDSGCVGAHFLAEIYRRKVCLPKRPLLDVPRAGGLNNRGKAEG